MPAITLDQLGRVLTLVAHPRSVRKRRRPGDVDGDFDEWFDGGAVQRQPGLTRYRLGDGTTLAIGAEPGAPLVATVVFPDGTTVEIAQREP